MKDSGFSLSELLVGLVVFGLIVAGGLLVYSHVHKSSAKPSPKLSAQTTPAVSSAYAVLSPATVPSKMVECSQTISYDSNGVPGPVQCSNGDLNTTDWDALSALEPSVLTLGYSASASEVQSALCSDVSANISNPIELTVYQIAALYYGWNFSSNPSVVLTNGTCSNTDD